MRTTETRELKGRVGRAIEVAPASIGLNILGNKARLYCRKAGARWQVIAERVDSTDRWLFVDSTGQLKGIHNELNAESGTAEVGTEGVWTIEVTMRACYQIEPDQRPEGVNTIDEMVKHDFTAYEEGKIDPEDLFYQDDVRVEFRAVR